MSTKLKLKENITKKEDKKGLKMIKKKMFINNFLRDFSYSAIQVFSY